MRLGRSLALLLTLAMFFVACESDTEDPIPPGDPYRLVEASEYFGLDPVDAQADELLPAMFELGRSLFYEPILSLDSTIACGSCHQQEFAFSDAGNAVSVGVHGATGTINAPAVINAAWTGVAIARAPIVIRHAPMAGGIMVTGMGRVAGMAIGAPITTFSTITGDMTRLAGSMRALAGTFIPRPISAIAMLSPRPSIAVAAATRKWRSCVMTPGAMVISSQAAGASIEAGNGLQAVENAGALAGAPVLFQAADAD